MKVRLKVKHLIVTIAILLLFIPLMFFVIGPYAAAHIAEQKAISGDMKAKENLLETLETMPNSEKKWSIIREHMIDGPLYSRFDVYVGPSFTHQVHKESIPFSKEERLPYLIDYVKEGPVDEGLQFAASDLSRYYVQEGDLAKAYEILDDAIDRFSIKESFYKDELILEKIKLAVDQKEYDKANTFIQDVLKQVEDWNIDIVGQITMLEADMLIQQGKVEEAYDKVVAEMESFQKKEQIDIENDDMESVVYQQLERFKESLETRLERDNKTVSIKGTILRHDGTPLEDVGVFLREENMVNHSVTPDERYQVLTDENGQFVFHDVYAGNYQLNLGFTFEQIDGYTWPLDWDDWIEIDGDENIVTYDITIYPLMELETPVNHHTIKEDTVHFEWEEVEGADYYKLHVGYEVEDGWLSTEFKSFIDDTEIDVPVEDLYNRTTGLIFDNEEWTSIIPETILAFTNSDSRFSWSVEAYRENGEMITRSNGYRLQDKTIGNLPFFYLKERELTEADQLLLDRQIDKAIEAYKQRIDENPNDTHSLRILVRLLGVAEREGGEVFEDQMSYLEKLAKISNHPSHLYELVEYHYEKQNWDQYNNWFEEYESVEEQLTDYMLGIHGTALMKQGKWNAAKTFLQQSIEQDSSHRFIGNLLAVYVYENDFEQALQWAITSPEHDPSHDKIRWDKLIQSLMKESNKFPHYEEEIQHVLNLYFQNKEQKLQEWMESTELLELKKFVEAVIEVD